LEYLLFQNLLPVLATGEQASPKEVRAIDMTVPGIVAHESAKHGGVSMGVPSF
jgi:hypothetical protein